MVAYGTVHNAKQVAGCFLIYSSLINIVHLKCSTTKNVRSKQAGDCFLAYSPNVRLRKMCAQSKR